MTLDNLLDQTTSLTLGTIDQLVKSNPYLGFIILGIFGIFWFVFRMIKFLPEFDTFRATVLKPFAKNRRFKSLTKAAIKYDIRGNVNKAVQQLKLELPSGWIRDLDIQWVSLEEREDFLNEGEIVIRARPFEDQDRNFANVTYHFLRKCFFPKVKNVIPEIHREAAVLCVSNRIIEGWNKRAKEAFIDYILEPMITKKAKILNYYVKYNEIDERGLFTGPFLREVHDIAERIKITPLRQQMGSEVVSVLKHLDDFKKGIEAKERNKESMPDGMWSREGVTSKYAILLVANPYKAELGVQPYVNRAKERYIDGADRLYVLGSNRERTFVEKVIRTIEHNTNFVLKEIFEQAKDYRGSGVGLGALFVRKN